MRKRMTAVARKRNLLGKLVRGRLSISQADALSRDELLDMIDMGYLLPIAGGATSSTNTVLANPSYFPRAIVVSTDQTVNQGDMVWWDGVNFTLKVLTLATQVAIGATGGYCGVAQGTNVPGVFPNPPAGAPSENLPGVVVQRGGSARLNLQANDVIDFPFQAVTAAGVDAQTVTKGAATSANRVGLVIIPPPVNARGSAGATPAPETVAGGSSVEVWIEPKFPATALV